MKKNIFCFAVIFCSVFAGSQYGEYRSKVKTKEQLQTIINWNTKQIHSLGVAAATDKHNSELLIQILNKIEERPVKPVPKFIPMGDIVSDDPFIEDDDVPLTFEQVAKDQREVDQSIRAFASNNLFQAEAFHNILQKLE